MFTVLNLFDAAFILSPHAEGSGLVKLNANRMTICDDHQPKLDDLHPASSKTVKILQSCFPLIRISLFV